MRSYRIGLLMVEGGRKSTAGVTLGEVISRRSLNGLKPGTRYVPWPPGCGRRSRPFRGPLGLDFDRAPAGRNLAATDDNGRRMATEQYRAWVPDFVAQINAVVVRMEQLYTFGANLQRSFRLRWWRWRSWPPRR